MNKKIYLSVLCIMFIVGCTDAKQKSSSDFISEADTGVADDSFSVIDSNNDRLSVVKLENSSDPILIDSDFYEAYLNKSNKKIADEKKYALYSYTRLKDGQDHFTYYLIDSLNFSRDFKSYLIAEYYESENAVWLVNFDNKGNYIDAVELYYDNAEGFCWEFTKIEIDKRTLLITTGTIYTDSGDPEEITAQATIDKNGKIISNHK